MTFNDTGMFILNIRKKSHAMRRPKERARECVRCCRDASRDSPPPAGQTRQDSEERKLKAALQADGKLTQ